MTVPSPPDGRARTISSPQNPNYSPSVDPHLIPLLPPRFPTSHETSPTRGRAYSAASSQNVSPSGSVPATHGQNKRSFDTGLERKPSQPYGHHRQTSILNGVQHSRNPSLLSPVNTSPLSPQRRMEPATPDSAGGPAGTDMMKIPSVSQLHGNTSNGSLLPVNRGFESDSPQRRPERMHSGRFKRAHDHQRSLSRNQTQPAHELKTVGEYALHHLLTSFVAEADKLIERCMERAGEHEPQVEDVCGPGANPAFDQLISSLGHINRHKPKSLIDSVVRWRKDKSHQANAKMTDLHMLRESMTVPGQTSPSGTFTGFASLPGGQNLVKMESEAKIAERKSVISIYILCRVLIEAVGQTTLVALNGSDLNTAARLEEVIYGQLQNAEPESLAHSPLRKANWIIRGQLLGVMSGIRFEAVVSRFIKDLEVAQLKLSVKGLADPRLAAKTAMLVQSMRWLKVRSYPEDAWEHSCSMLQILAKFFAEVHGRTMKHAYAELFEHLLLPVAATATVELNTPKWKDVLTIIQPKITQMVSKADHWPYVFPLQAVLLCVSPADQFASQWSSLVATSQARARDRSGRSHVLKAICRLVWRYLYRYEDSQSAVSKRLDEVVKLVFQSGKRAMISTDPVIADPLIQLIRIIGYKHQDLCFRTIIFPLMNSDLFSGPESHLKIESLDPEKTVIGIRAFLAVMTDLEKAQPPPFPKAFECDALIDPSSRSPITHRRTKSQGFAVSAGRTERLSQPVLTTNFNEVSKEYYVKFCKLLGQLTIICDNTFGGQAVLDERIATHTPKTPMAEAFNFNKREDVTNPTDLRQHYYDLFHVAVEALPRCLSPHLPINALVNLLCTGTAHMQSHIASSSAQSLKSISKQSYAQQVTMGFARFIFSFDDRYATVSDGGLLGPGHIESTLKLYVELLEIWIDDIQKRTQTTAADLTEEERRIRQLPLDLSSVLAQVDEVEGHGLFFLCSPSRTVRAIAVNVLRLVTKFDTALGKPSNRIISILEEDLDRVISVNDEQLSIAERSRLQKGSRKGTDDSILVELCSSDALHDTALWFKLFPNVVRLTAKDCLQAVAFTRELVCQRLSHSYKTIHALSEGNKQTSNAAFELALSTREGGRFNSSSPDVIIEQWKVHLIFACTTVTYVSSSNTQPPKSSHGPQHIRKNSKSSTTSQEKITSANELFSRVVPFLSVQNQAVRNAAVIGLGATNAALYQTLLQALQPYVMECNSEAKERVALHQRNFSSPRRVRRTDCLRTEITHLLSLTSHLLKDEPILKDDFAVTYLLDYAKHLRLFLSDADVQSELDFQRLRTHFCSLIEGIYDCTRELKDSTLRMSFQARQAAFTLMENWCGFSPNERQLRQREDLSRRSILASELDVRKQNVIDSALEKQRIELQNAALSAMAALCAGPLTFAAEGRILMQFDVRRMLAWIGSIFENASDRAHATGRRALQNLIVHNQDQSFLIAQTMRMCYITNTPKTLASYFEVVTRVVTESSTVAVPYWKILCLALHTLSSEDRQIRMKSARLLRTYEQSQTYTSTIQDLEISLSDKTTAVYKLAQFEASQRLSKQHPELAFHVFSEFSAYFNDLPPDQQRNLVSAMLPWIQTMELQLDSSGGPTAPSYMLLVNLFEITVKSSIAIHNEIQALWQALATGPYGGNALFVLDFIISICLDKREHNFVVYAKQIVVFLSKTPAGARVLDHLLLQITPKTMINERREAMPTPTDTAGLPYIADLASILPSGTKQTPLSLGQICTILLVDLIVSPFTLQIEKLPALLQAVLVQWDQNIIVVQDHARELLVHLIHELVISKIDPETTQPDKKSIEKFIEAIRGQDARISWSYADTEIGRDDGGSRTVSSPMSYVVDKLVEIFSVITPGLREGLGRISMEWATTCAVRHIACRSFQIFRCISTAIDSKMLVDMLARLANTIADDESPSFPMFSLEILTTLRTAIGDFSGEKLQQYPQMFWVTCACLGTIFESEFQEGLSMLELILDKIDLSDGQILAVLSGSKPPAWEGLFQGVHALLRKGIRSQRSMERSICLMQRLIKVPSNDIVGPDDRVLFTVLANLPRYLRAFELGGRDTLCLESAREIAATAEAQNHGNLSRVLHGFAMSRYRNQNDFLAQCIAAIRTSYFPAHEFESLVFLLGMVNNQCDWFKVKTMQVLGIVIANTDMRKPEIVSQGADLISPLLRLLQTGYCQQALVVLDNVIDISETPLDNKHLRMSMVGSHSSRATRKEYESTQSLYGIPEETGWSIPVPAIRSMRTRHNVAAILPTVNFDTLVESNEGAVTPEVEFQNDEYQDSYFGSRSDTLVSDDTKVDGNMGELAMKLDSLDDFFDELSDAISPMEPSHEPYLRGLIEERENLYDQQALPILRQSLKRNPSVNSFQTGFSELYYPPSREPNIMNPVAFAHNGNTPVRPGLHNRSATSPVMTTKKTLPLLQNDQPSGDEDWEEPESFSDDEISLERSHTLDDSQQTQKPVGFKAGFRQGLRRLTSSGSKAEAREALKTSVPGKSPKVPKLPASYYPVSAEP